MSPLDADSTYRNSRAGPIDERAVNLQSALIVNEAQLPERIHEETDP